MKDLITQFYPYAKKQLGFDRDVKVILRGDYENAKNPLGMTGHYDPSNDIIVLYTTNRHPKDILRSFAHELTHHAQNCRGEFEGGIEGGPGYAQNNPHLRNMELEAYLRSILVRDWEDTIKGGDTTMSITEKQIREMVRGALSIYLKEEEDKLTETEEQDLEEGNVEEIEEDCPHAQEDPQAVQMPTDKEWWEATLQENLMKKFIK